ncbi:MAG: isoprenylcysteine carboxyl methyltransferase [Zetaproteobacteria bacterium CG12_big_fil_rev_8_21_14_0_65_54_13]|nr:MAG: isoprenylcysteine carboxyl methyltransferase [Zetaproteobacteria bacterium CG23_combo_of_CG06-09_8_20_14_all_54_7]PIW50321.1 MAG: isoprenylcysteine carboxyl methyltransferase [Zetaproteobacteria bacterium CG12_big_fil_rev_8_21_14_0_65_54_13]PIX55380.1 MAG: isoprenylcysteine carboxyl methyltransferase [Zetaproteobacteria bacterium CG_4_10_14_3_um_filter_54_28]PJA27117.1 MAG: isoprenylcysteine carboxyl methyltransferase [Zetaproteobacteria bacterium CG_4_9_14_3_um_filter_54_145]
MMQRLRLKIPPPLVAMLCGLLIWALAELLPVQTAGTALRQMLALFLLALAIGIDMAALIHFRKAGTSIDPRYPHKTTMIVGHGIYARTRNPMYLGLVLILSSLGLWLGSIAALPVIVIFICYMNYFQIAAEEEHLSRRFGDAYRAYKARVRRWI